LEENTAVQKILTNNVFLYLYRDLFICYYKLKIKLSGVDLIVHNICYDNLLGLELIFPEDGEVNYEHDEKSLDEYIRILTMDIDCSKRGIAPFYLQ